SQLAKAVDNVNKDFERYELGKAYEHLYHFIWDDFADWYIEVSKTQYNASVLVYVLENILKLTHPFAPYVTETIWDTLKWEKTLLVNSDWPEIKAGDKKQTRDFEELKNIISEIRHLRTQLQLRKNTLYYT